MKEWMHISMCTFLLWQICLAIIIVSPTDSFFHGFKLMQPLPPLSMLPLRYLLPVLGLKQHAIALTELTGLPSLLPFA